jgi:hypothetical protein
MVAIPTPLAREVITSTTRSKLNFAAIATESGAAMTGNQDSEN